MSEEIQQEESSEQTETENETPNEENGGELEGEVVITLDGETPPQEEEKHEAAPQWVKELRKSHKEVIKENRELKEKLAKAVPEQPKQTELSKKPTLEECGYDEDVFESKLTAWHNQKRDIEIEQNRVKAEAEAANKEWQDKLSDYSVKKKELKVKNFEDAEENALAALSITQQGIILRGASNPAMLIFALGSNPKKLKELSEIKDPVVFACKIGELGRDMKVTNRKAAPAPEKVITSAGGKISGTVDSQLDALRAEAEKTGDYSKVIAHKARIRNAK